MSATASPKVSVIVPVHNTAPWLDRCVESVRAQTLRDIEIILVENRSTDASPRVVRRLSGCGCAHPCAAPRRSGVVACPQCGAGRCDGSLRGVRRQRRLHRTRHVPAALRRCGRKRAQIAYGDLIYEEEGTPQPAEPAGPVTVRTPDEVLCDLLLERISASACTKLFDRTLFEGLQFPLDVWFEDHRVVHEWVARCRRIAYVEKVCYHYVQRDGSICHSFSAPKHYHFFLANFERFEFVRRQRLFEGRTEQDAICDKLVRNCLYNFREAMRRRHASDFAEAVADMRRKLARMYEVKAQLPPATRKRLRRVVKHYGWYYLTHFVFRKKR